MDDLIIDYGSNGDDVDIDDGHYDDDRNDEKEMVASDLFVFVFVFSLAQRRRREGNEKEMVAGVWPLTPRQLQLVRERERAQSGAISSHLNTAACLGTWAGGRRRRPSRARESVSGI